MLVQFSGPHLYHSIILLISLVWVFQGHTYIDRSLSCQFEFSLSFWGCTHIDRPSFYHFVLNFNFWDRTYIDRSFSLSCHFNFSGSHRYQLTIFLSVCVQFELGPHLCQSVIFLSVWVFGTAPILIDHLSYQFEFNLSFQGRTYINRSFSYQFMFSSSWDRTYIDQSSSCQFEFEFLGSYLYWSVIFHVS